MNNNYGNMFKAFKNMMPETSLENENLLEDMVVFPGIEELFSLIKIKEIYEKNIFDLIVVDCAPTGETLSLLKFPELLSWYIEKLFPIGKVALKVLRPISKVALKIEMPDKHALNDIEKLYVNLCELQSLLKNRNICSIRLVTIPEKMVVEETKRNYMYLNLYNFNVDGIYINRVMPAEIENNFFDEWKKIQGEYIEKLKEVFLDMPTYKVRWYEIDINGFEGLQRIINDSLEDENIFNVLKINSNETFKKLENGYSLTLKIPFAEKNDFDLFESSNEIIIKIGNFKRNIPLPDVVRKYSISNAKFENGELNIIFS